MKFNQHSKFKKRIGLAVISCMLIQALPASIFNAKEAYAATGLRHVAVGDSEVILGGNYIEVGISKSGSFGTKNKTDDFHSEYNGIGLAVDGDGFDTGKAPTTGDFFLPGSPEESFTVGYKLGSSSATPMSFTNAERMGLTQIPMTTKDTTEGELLSAESTGKTMDSHLEISQKITFKVDNKFFKNTLTYTNTGAETLYDLRYMRSFDPDQDADLHGINDTYNEVIENFPQDSRAIVRASGAVTKEPVFFISTDPRARASSFGFDNRNPYSEEAYQADGSLLKKGEILYDQAIAITFALGNLAPGESVNFEYYTSLDPNYESGLDDIMGSLGLQINEGATKTNNLNVTLNLNGSNVKEMCFSNDGLAYSDFEPYTASKAWTLTSGRGLKTVYAKFRDSKNNESILLSSIEYNSIPTVTDASVSMRFENPYTFASLAFTSEGKFKDADDDVLDQIKITALPTKGLLQLKGQDVMVNEKILVADLSDLVYLPGESYYSEDSFKWIASDGSDYSLSEAKMTMIINPGLPIAPEKFLISPIKDQIILGGNSINLEWNSAKSNSGTPMTYKLDFFDGNLWSTLYQGTETSFEFSDTLEKNTASAKFRVSAIDEVGNSGYTLSDDFMIDSVLPAISSVLQTPTTWTAGNVTISVEADDKLSGLPEKPYSFDGGTTWQATSSKTFEENAASVVMVRDSAGNIQELKAIEISNIDKIAPTGTILMDILSWKEVISKITFGLFFKESIQVTITAEDTSSGIQKVEYAKSNAELTLEEVQHTSTWTLYAKPFTETADDEKQVIYYVKLTDNVGNITYLSSNGIIFDTRAPGITGIIDKETYYVDQIVTVSDLYMDTLIINGDSFLSGSALPGNQEVTYSIIAKDKAGNPTSYTVYSRTIASLDDSVEGLTGDNVKSSDKENIEAALFKVIAVIGTTHNGATEDQIKALETMKQHLESLLGKIQDMKDLLADIDTKINEITLENVKDSDKANLISILDTINDLLSNKLENLTAVEITALEENKAEIENLLARIKEIAEILSITESNTKDFMGKNLKSSDIPALKSNLAVISDLLKNYDNNLLDEEKAALEIMKQNLENLSMRIQDMTDLLADIDTRINEITLENVKDSDKANLISILDTINDLLSNKLENLTAVEITALEENKAEIENLLARIKEIAETLSITESNTKDFMGKNLKSIDIPALKSNLAVISDLLKNYDNNLLDEEKAALEIMKQNLENLSMRIQDMTDLLADIDTRINEITLENVKDSDKANLISILDTINDLLSNKLENLTAVEITALEENKAEIENLLARIKEIVETLSTIESNANDILGKNLKSSDIPALKSNLAVISDFLKNYDENLQDEERSALEGKKADIENRLTELIKITETITSTDNLIQNIHSENLKKEDLLILKQSEAQFEKILSDFNDNLTDEEKDIILKKITSINEMLMALDAVQAFEDKINALPDLDNLHKTDLENVNMAGAAYDELTDHQKSLVEPAVKDKYDNIIKTFGNVLLTDPKTGTTVEGIDGTIFNLRTHLVVTPIMDTLDAKVKALISSGVTLVAKDKSVAELYEIQLLLDGKAVQPDGKIKISLKITEKMKSFKDLQVVYVTESGTATIIPSEQIGDEIVFVTDHLSYYGVIGTNVNADTYPKTGDTTNPVPYYFLGAASLLLAFVLIKKSKA